MKKRFLSQTYICLRCQLFFARRCSLSRVGIAFQSTKSPTQVSQLEPESDIKNTTLGGQLASENKYRRISYDSPRSTSQFPRHRRSNLFENRQPLKTDNLGRPAEVIVLRNSNVSRYGPKKWLEDEKGHSIDIMAKLDEETGVISQTEVDKNIEKLKPSNESMSNSWQELSSIIDGLQEGFTSSQLYKYILLYGNSRKATSPDLNISSKPQVSSWMPGISKSTDRLEQSPTRGYDRESHTSKGRLATRLIRECWGLGSSEIEGGIGEVEVQVSFQDFDYLLNGSSSQLRAISKRHIAVAGEKIEAFRTRGVIRITSTYARSKFIIRDILTTIESIIRLEVSLEELLPASQEQTPLSLKSWLSENFNDKALAEVSQLTRTDIVRSSENTLLISAIGKSDSVTGNATEVVRRLFLTSKDFSGRNHTSFGCLEASRGKNAFVKYGDVSSLPWRERLQEWTRWTKSISKEDILKQNATSPAPVNVVKIGSRAPDTDELVNNQLEPAIQATCININDLTELNSIASRTWDETHRIESSAILGSVLHSQPRSALSLGLNNGPESGALHTFCTTVPGLSQILNECQLVKPDSAEALILRFQPNPWGLKGPNGATIGAAALDVFPPVEIGLTINRNTKEISLSYVQAVIEQKNTDLLLPDTAADVRYQQREISHLNTENGQTIPSIVEFLKSSRLQVATGQRIATPGKLILPVSAHLCQRPGLFLLGKDAGTDGEVEYLFAGLEYTKTVTLCYKDFTLLYTNIESGKANGQRSEVRLLPIQRRGLRLSEAHGEKAFIECSQKLAQIVGANTSMPQGCKPRSIDIETMRDIGNAFMYYPKKIELKYELAEEHA